MSTKTHRSGGKYTGSHTTLHDEFACRVADIVANCPHVYKIAITKIDGGLRVPRNRHVKISVHSANCYRLSIRGNMTYVQIEVYIIGDRSLSGRAFACALRDSGISICFDEKDRKRKNRWRDKRKQSA